MELETRRKLLHASGIVFSFYIKWTYFRFGIIVPIATFGAAILAGYSIAELYKRNIRFPVISKLIDVFERPEVIKQNPGKGALMFFLGAFVSLIFFNDINIVSASIAILALGDSASTLVGRNFGKHKIFYNRQKSWEGTLSGFLFAFLGAVTQINFYLAFFGAFTAMFVESLPLKVDDNLTVPVSAGAAMAIAGALVLNSALG